MRRPARSLPPLLPPPASPPALTFTGSVPRWRHCPRMNERQCSAPSESPSKSANSLRSEPFPNSHRKTHFSTVIFGSLVHREPTVPSRSGFSFSGPVETLRKMASPPAFLAPLRAVPSACTSGCCAPLSRAAFTSRFRALSTHSVVERVAYDFAALQLF